MRSFNRSFSCTSAVNMVSFGDPNIDLLSGLTMALETADIVVVAGTVDSSGVIAGGVSNDWMKSIARMEIGEAHSYHVVELLIVLEYYNTN